MSNTHHPGEQQLLRYADGELAASEAAAVRRHLEACWQCRAEFESLQKIVSGCVTYRNALAEGLPAPPKPWDDLYTRMAEIDAARREPWHARFAALLRGPAIRRWAPVALALGLMIGLNQRPGLTPSVQAAELLAKAMAAAESRPAAPRRLRIRTSRRTFVRAVNAKAEPSPVDTRFDAAGYDSRDPLSARSYARWRERLDSKTDEVAEADGAYRIRTATASGDLAEATLALRAADLHPFEGAFRFRDREFVEITELPAEPAPAGEPSVAAPLSVRETPAPVPAPPPAAAPATIGDELHVIAALQAIGADLGEAVEVTRGERIAVRGVGIAPSRRQQIELALAAIPRVDLQFTDALPAPGVGKRTQAVQGNAASALHDRIAEQLGGRAQVEELAAAALDEADHVMARVYALRRLAARFPRQAEEQLNTADRATLNRLVAQHAAALYRHAASLEGRLAPLLTWLGASAVAPDKSLSGSWQQAAGEMFESARRTERLLAALLGGASTDVAAETIPSGLRTCLGDLRAKAEVYQGMM
jgi:hypothetical protein